MLNSVFPKDSPSYFPVSLQSVHVGDDQHRALADQFQAVVRNDTGAVLGIHRGHYRLVPNRQVFQTFEDVLVESGIGLEGVWVSEGVAYQGRTTVREYVFPGITVKPRVGDTVEFKLQVINSYDATVAFRAVATGRRLACLNGLVLPGDAAVVYGRHTAGFSPERIVAKIREAMDRYVKTEVVWSRWAERDVRFAQVEAVFATMPGANPKRLARLTEAYDTETQVAGATVWALYNALTRWSTHAPVRRAAVRNRAVLVVNRELEVRHALRSPAFRALAA